MVHRPLELSFGDLLRRPLTEADITLACVSNQVGGLLAGNARWLGASLRALLREAGVHAGADQILSTSNDGWTAGTPTAVVMSDPDALLAVGMNGQPLPAVTKAGLVDTLNSAPGITVFAPDNAAFAKIPTATLNSVLGNKAELTKILTYHVASGHITPAELASGKPIKTLEGSTVMPSKMGRSYEVNSVPVVCGNVQTANATVYIIGSVLMPPTH